MMSSTYLKLNEKKRFVLKLMPCRPSFAQDMTEHEREIMKAHNHYLQEWKEKGNILLFGPMLHRQGTYSLGIAIADSEEEMVEIIVNDPAARLHTYSIYPMPAVMAED